MIELLLVCTDLPVIFSNEAFLIKFSVLTLWGD